ncbi:hypothetical protein GCM10023235_14710 [Kitasatospora terrestris]|uniref:HTH marR-type domain-containing protein n=2 Tax=Kitasatospora terrestris TaxID=258051 RepID=A0ABP9DEZ9_9ACTN
MVSSAALTNRIDRLVEKGLVDRALDPDHRRRMLISLTEQGLRLVNEAADHHLANERTQLAGLTDDEQQQLATLLRRLLVSLGDEA